MPAAPTFTRPNTSRRTSSGGPSTESLFRRYQSDGDPAAREALVERFLPLARTLARRFWRSSEPHEDLMQIASLALVKAIDRFDPERGASFQSYAIPTILGELRRDFRDSGWAVHVARSAQERAMAVQDAVELLSREHGRPPTVQQLALYLELPEVDVLDGLQVASAYTATSLDAPVQNGDEDETTLATTLGAHDNGYEHVETVMLIENALASLTDRERRLLQLRFVDELTQAQIGTQLGVSQMQISRLLRATLAKLRESIDEPRSRSSRIP
jgi:RNA polymerase sigma-B factor